MELTKQDRRVLKDIIRIGILRRCEEWLAETSALINKVYTDDENAFDRCMNVTKRSRDFFKEAMSREDYYRNTMIELGIENLLFEGYLTEADFVGCREELRTFRTACRKAISLYERAIVYISDSLLCSSSKPPCSIASWTNFRRLLKLRP